MKLMIEKIPNLKALYVRELRLLLSAEDNDRDQNANYG